MKLDPLFAQVLQSQRRQQLGFLPQWPQWSSVRLESTTWHDSHLSYDRPHGRLMGVCWGSASICGAHSWGLDKPQLQEFFSKTNLISSAARWWSAFPHPRVRRWDYCEWYRQLIDIDCWIISGWWFGTFFYFSIYIGNNNPNWQIFFRGVVTTNQICIIYIYIELYSRKWGI